MASFVFVLLIICMILLKIGAISSSSSLLLYTNNIIVDDYIFYFEQLMAVELAADNHLFMNLQVWNYISNEFIFSSQLEIIPNSPQSNLSINEIYVIPLENDLFLLLFNCPLQYFTTMKMSNFNAKITIQPIKNTIQTTIIIEKQEHKTNNNENTNQQKHK
jgi:hypothetical protein